MRLGVSGVGRPPPGVGSLPVWDSPTGEAPHPTHPLSTWLDDVSEARLRAGSGAREIAPDSIDKGTRHSSCATNARSNSPPSPRSTARTEPLPLPVDGGLRVAVVHDWCPNFRGGERVLAADLQAVPEGAEVFTLFDFLPDDVKEQYFRDVEFHTSAANRLPMIEKYYRSLFFLCPFLIEQFDVTGYDVVISSSAAFARGVLTRPDQPHLCYVHSPVRYAWDEQFSYLAAGAAWALARRGCCFATCCTACAPGTRAPRTVPT